MNEYSFLIAIAGVLLVGAMSPGPSFLVVAQHSLSESRSHGIATAFGTASGVAIFAVLASLGITTVIEQVPTAYVIFKLLGGLYLMYLAWKIWVNARQRIATTKTVTGQNKPLMRCFLVGLATQMSNPKTALVIAGIFAAFVPVNPPVNTTLFVALVAFVIDFSWYAIVATVLSNSRARDAYQRAKIGFDRVAAILLGAVGLRLLISKVELG